MRTSARIIITTCSATLIEFEYVTSATVIPFSIARLEVDVVGPDPGGHGQLQVRRLGDPLGGQVRGPERLRDDDLRVRKLALEGRVRPVLVGRDRRARGPRPSMKLRSPSSPETLPSSSPGVKSIDSGDGVVWPPW